MIKTGKFSGNYSRVGNYTGWAVFIIGVIYAVITLIGLLALDAPGEPISDPWFTIMECLIILIAPLMAINMVSIHYYADALYKVYSLAAVCLMFIMAAITSCIHFVVLTTGHTGMFAFEWPSVVYALDILAWDWFYPLSMLSAAFVFRKSRLERTIRLLMIISALLSLAGLLGIPLNNMQVRNIGIMGYAVLGPVIFLLTGILMKKQ